MGVQEGRRRGTRETWEGVQEEHRRGYRKGYGRGNGGQEGAQETYGKGNGWWYSMGHMRGNRSHM